MGRWQFVQATSLFAGAPFYVLFLLGAAAAAVRPIGSRRFPWVRRWR